MELVKLPWDLEEEILSRLPPRSLVRFRSVCKHWNDLFNDKRFHNNHFARARPQFIFLTESKISYSIDIDLRGTIEVREVVSDFTCQAMDLIHTTITACDGLLFRDFWKQGVAVWNPWLRQVRWIEYEDKGFHFCGVGYDSCKPEKSYKILGYFNCLRKVSDTYHVSYRRVAIYECSSHALKFIDAPFTQWPIMAPLSLNGNLYWLTHEPETYKYFIRSFDFSKEIFKPFCLLPCLKNRSRDELVLAVFKRDRFSLLKQCNVTGKIDIWVTKKKIDGEEVVWINLMTLPTTNLPKLVNKFCGISYFIYDKTLIMCCGDHQTGAACIYFVKGDIFKKIQIDSGSVRFSHCVYLPNLLSVPL
ncbi:F-box domain [Arabidopsis suecica]|uniref:F-box domain n=1 Tax=Arabidopsis suecica TaxID=45249 RepID=A0A8T2BNQ1_ARASU|nr:F-box domain [Arabidopsis suecica]